MMPFILLGLIIVVISWKELFSFRKTIAAELASATHKGLSVFKDLYLLTGTLVVITALALTGLLFAKDIKAYISQNKLLTPVSLLDKEDYQPLPQNPKIGTFYNVWWNNFSHYKDFPYGDWSKTTLTPEAGYYTSKNSYYVQHIKQMKESGIDYVLIPYHLYDRKRYLTFAIYAEKLGIYYAPNIELGDVLSYGQFRPIDNNGNELLGFSLSDKSRAAIENVAISSLVDNLDSPALLRIEQKPAIFVFFGDWFLPSWDEESRLKLADNILLTYLKTDESPFTAISKSWGVEITSKEDLLKHFPKDIQGFNQNNQIAIDYKEAFLQEYDKFWTIIKNNLESEVGEVFLLSTYPPLDPSATIDPASQEKIVIQFDDFPKIDVFDSEYFYGISSTWYSWNYFTNDSEEIKTKWENQIEEQSLRNKEANKNLFLTITPAYDESLVRPYNPFEPIPPEINGINTFDWGWETALKYDPDYILITSWNEFFEGTAIEPSQEYGDYYIKRAAEWAEKLDQ